MANRSIPGQGAKCGIYLLMPADGFCDHKIRIIFGTSAIMASIDEDFAESSPPVVVKVQKGVSAAQLAQHLRDLTKALEEGVYQRVVEPPSGDQQDLTGALEDEFPF